MHTYIKLFVTVCLVSYKVFLLDFMPLNALAAKTVFLLVLLMGAVQYQTSTFGLFIHRLTSEDITRLLYTAPLLRDTSRESVCLTVEGKCGLWRVG